MGVVCHCPNCLGEVIGRFQRTCAVCGGEIPVDLRMAGVAELEAYPSEVRRASRLHHRVFAVAVGAPEIAVSAPDPNPFEEEAADERSPDEPREMDWEDDEPAEPARRRRWFRR